MRTPPLITEFPFIFIFKSLTALEEARVAAEANAFRNENAKTKKIILAERRRQRKLCIQNRAFKKVPVLVVAIYFPYISLRLLYL